MGREYKDKLGVKWEKANQKKIGVGIKYDFGESESVNTCFWKLEEKMQEYRKAREA